MDKGLVYDPFDEEVAKFQRDCMELLYDFNLTRPHELEKRQTLLKQMFGKIGENCYIEPPLHSNFGGRHVFMGNNVYANYNLTLVDDGNIYIGDNVMFGPNVSLYTAGHPIHPVSRNSGYEYGLPITIGDNVWLGGNVVVTPGVTIGENTVIGAGSVVVKDIPANVVAAGNPCRVVRGIKEEEIDYIYKDKLFDVDDYK